MEVISDPVEQVTALTDFAMAVVAALGIARFISLLPADRFKAGLWIVIYGLFINAALLGTAYHGLALGESTLDTLWTGIFISLGIMVALFVVGLVRDWLGQPAAVRAIPVMLVIAAGFIIASYLMGQDYRLVLAYEALALLAALIGYFMLALKGTPGGAAMTVGVALTIIAAVVQAGEFITFVPAYPVDHNSAYHLIQLAGVFFLTSGVGRSIEAASPRTLPA